jgi:thiosulfate/3-mercaptopyruvate sulfurtransferase
MHRTLIDAATLSDHLLDATWVVLDVRHDLADPAAGPAAYAAGHLPNAFHAHIDRDLSGPKTGHNGRHPLPAREALVERLRDWGVRRDTQIVAYDAHGGQFAGRLWWLARWLGHEAVAVLDGGYPAWLAAGGWVSQEAPDRLRGDFVPGNPLAPSVDAATLMSVLDEPARLVLDARTAERYEGRVEPIDPVAGHIPGAVNRFWGENLAPDARFKPAAQLRAEFEALLGGRSPAQLIAQCGSGVTACHHLLAMEHAGLAGAALYPGSWSEWIADPARPIATGPG